MSSHHTVVNKAFENEMKVQRQDESLASKLIRQSWFSSITEMERNSHFLDNKPNSHRSMEHNANGSRQYRTRRNREREEMATNRNTSK